jgi:hypothetical protein
MRKIAKAISLILVCALFVGCAPQDSLFPLFVKSDRVFEDQLLGEWIVQKGTAVKPDEKSGRAIFQTSGDAVSYEITLPDFDEHGEKLISAGRLVRLGSYLFIDVGSPEMGTEKNPSFPYPAIEGHVIGRVYLEKDKLHIDFLSDQWVSDQAKAGKLPLSSVRIMDQTIRSIPDRIVLSATTEELRKFAMQHAEDKEAFSETFAFQRKK